MIHKFAIAGSVLMLALAGVAAEKKIQMKDLPPAVKKAVEDQTKGSVVKGLSTEVESGKTLFEVETTINGHGRDLSFDASGATVEVEEEVALHAIPAAAKAAIEKRAAGGKITKVETVTKGNVVVYEAAIKKGLKTSEITVQADGSPAK
jgi:uncharacterized membrane protein YkoI